ncbi:hypothetical protein CO009_03590 [Candidatus Shapirobacteria bacterium CG_4_8_14_3_um_filter_35_11]|uniref:Transcriptional regulator, AbiEi antitoxin, Type IV TA system n=6 Tax=Candidatus Shapironibacteriota TaxID=1752721 RepID=A0A1J5I3E3_9BACT|nr:MAG: hypothetical protein AUK05_00755 [Candidatus Shapirobacteria bacterium CG2_30_35_20]PIV07043.1 MAG: hypothetical protein COS53_03190 [Candidatus Shapirobacteria bacterium CG03_land_8_20_14_0_80_35_14]PIX68001.1 MAG: hypothetical protein COZ41_02020 [Candidatus Shapirobacteria bacterium CG_4_10_14_3_um_filter_35_13]PJA51237.1 MAG: hypothetical protein CO168_00855 [Candidatus Shapirobacteria bacterium CG_4_9_14_3_um_filter_36_12]PJC79751.1 MAG: hypothetical protein CO009_03590 [Candidatus
MDSLITKLFQTSKTVFTCKDLALVWDDANSNNLNSKIAYYVKQKKIIRLTRGVYVKYAKYDPKELATSIYIPSYISFETVLREAGVIFQHYDTIFVASKWPKTMVVGETNITFRKLKNIVLYNSTGIVNKDNFSIATVERAFLDMIYLFSNQYFDNLDKIDWEKCREIVKIYNNKQLVLRLNEYQKKYAK